jgi:hypothetical protein
VGERGRGPAERDGGTRRRGRGTATTGVAVGHAGGGQRRVVDGGGAARLNHWALPAAGPGGLRRREWRRGRRHRAGRPRR